MGAFDDGKSKITDVAFLLSREGFLFLAQSASHFAVGLIFVIQLFDFCFFQAHDFRENCEIAKMDLSGLSNYEDNSRNENGSRLARGLPLFVEIEEILSDDTVKACLVLPAFGAPVDTRIHVRQVSTHNHKDSLAKHIAGSDYMPALRRGDIVTFDQSFVDDGDAYVSKISSRTHDKMRGNVQFLQCMARASKITVGKRGPYQAVTVCNGAGAYRATSLEDIEVAFSLISNTNWAGPGAGFIARTIKGNVIEYYVGKDNPLEAFLEEVEARGIFRTDKWLEIIPASKFLVSRDQIAREVDIKKDQEKVVGNIGRAFMPPKSIYPGFIGCGLILSDEDEWAYGGRTGNIHRVVSGIQPLSRAPACDVKNIPSRASEEYQKSNKRETLIPVTGLFSAELMEKMALDRAARFPQEMPSPSKSQVRGGFRNSRQSSDSNAPHDEFSSKSDPLIPKFW